VLKKLVIRGFLQLVAPARWREKATYTVPLEWDSPIAAGLSECRASLLEAPSESNGNGIGSPTVVGQGVPQKVPEQSHLSGTHTYISFIDNCSIERKDQIPPLKVPQGDIPSSDKKLALGSRSSKNPLKDLKNKSAPATSLNKGEQEILGNLSSCFENELGVFPKLTKTEIRDCSRIIAASERGPLTTAFYKTLLEMKGNLEGKRAGDVFMGIIKVAGNGAMRYASR
jgi:organic hydroperoxide reductase OsmC/OhrA